MSDTELTQTTPMQSKLNTIGVFIGTHGLAVFLVVYFTMFLYPKTQDERAQWIKDISELKMLVNPETRPITNRQAEAILGIVSENVVGYLYSWGQYPLAYGVQPPSPNESYYFGRESFRIPERSDATGAAEEDLADLRQMIQRFNTSIALEINDRQTRMRTQLDNSLRGAEIQVQRLALIRYEDTTLKEVWTGIEKEIRTVWAKYSAENEIHAGMGREIDLFYRFIERHPAYAALSKQSPEMVRAPKLQPPAVRDNTQLVEFVRAAIAETTTKQLKLGRAVGA